MFINLSAAKRITGLNVVKIWSMPNKKGKGAIGYVAILSNGKKVSSLLSRKKFFQDGIETRKANAKEVEIFRISDEVYRAKTDKGGKTDTIHTVTKYWDILGCNCQDFINQASDKNAFCKPYCKHIAALHLYLGYAKISDMVKKTA